MSVVADVAVAVIFKDRKGSVYGGAFLRRLFVFSRQEDTIRLRHPADNLRPDLGTFS
jgi:hypothetical protein